jgi:hypothetical protein
MEGKNIYALGTGVRRVRGFLITFIKTQAHEKTSEIFASDADGIRTSAGVFAAGSGRGVHRLAGLQVGTAHRVPVGDLHAVVGHTSDNPNGSNDMNNTIAEIWSGLIDKIGAPALLKSLGCDFSVYFHTLQQPLLHDISNVNVEP